MYRCINASYLLVYNEQYHTMNKYLYIINTCQFSSLKTAPRKYFLPHLSLSINYCYVMWLLGLYPGQHTCRRNLRGVHIGGSLARLLSHTLPMACSAAGSDQAPWGTTLTGPKSFPKLGPTQLLCILALLPKLFLWAKGFFLSPSCTSVFHFINVFSHPLPVYCSEEPYSLTASSLIAAHCVMGIFGILQLPIPVN